LACSDSAASLISAFIDTPWLVIYYNLYKDIVNKKGGGLVPPLLVKRYQVSISY